jgi:hypothetical protein
MLSSGLSPFKGILTGTAHQSNIIRKGIRIGDIPRYPTGWRQERNMAQIFVSHSAKDGELVSFFAKAGVGTKVRLVFEEFEKIMNGSVTPLQVTNNISYRKPFSLS